MLTVSRRRSNPGREIVRSHRRKLILQESFDPMLTSLTILLTVAFLLLSLALVAAIVGLMTVADTLLRHFSHRQITSHMMSTPYADLSGLSF
jgi:hypothetical protein